MASSAIKISAPKKDMSTQRRMEIKEAEWETTFEHTKCSFSCSAVSLALSQAVIILHGAPCYAISAVKHQRKWIIENMIFWSGVVKEPFPLPAVASPAVHWSVGSLNLSQSQSLRHRTNTLHYSTLEHLATQTPLQISETLLFASLYSTLTELTQSSKKKKRNKERKKPQSVIAKSNKKKERKKKERDVYIKEKKKHWACGYNYTQAAQW